MEQLRIVGGILLQLEAQFANEYRRDLTGAHIGLSLSLQPQLLMMPALSRDEREKLIANTRLLVRVAEYLKRHQVGG